MEQGQCPLELSEFFGTGAVELQMAQAARAELAALPNSGQKWRVMLPTWALLNAAL